MNMLIKLKSSLLRRINIKRNCSLIKKPNRKHLLIKKTKSRKRGLKISRKLIKRQLCLIKKFLC